MSTAFVRGQGKFVDDIRFPNLLHLSVLRSPYAHARIKSIDLSRVKSLRAFGPIEVNSLCTDLPVIWTAEGMKRATQPVLARGKVRYVGQPVACVVAENPDAAADALSLIDVEYEPLKPVLDPETSIGADAPVLHDELYTDNVGLHVRNKQGNVEQAFAQANIVFKEKFRISRVAPAPIEGRGVIASYDSIKGELTVHSSTQIPYMLRHVLAITLKMAENKIRVIVPNVGGGFGGKDSVYPEEVLACVASMVLGKPVKWVEERSENLTASHHDRDQVQFVEVAAKSDGTLSALRVKILINAGAYYRFHGAREAFIVLFMLSGQYRIQNLEAEALSVLTNTMSTFPYRGPGSTEACFLIERVMNSIAKRTGLDPVVVRERNLIRELPYQTVTGAEYDSGDYQKCLEIALELSGYEKFRAEKDKASHPTKRLGIGIGCYLEQAGLGPSRIIGRLGIRQGGWEKSSVIVDQSGKVSVICGIQPIGQGTEQGIAKIVAKELGIPSSEISVLCGDTSLASFGGGAFASRQTAVGGTASVLAAREVRKKILKIASHMLEANLQDLTFENGIVRVRGTSSPSLSLRDIADCAYIVANMPPDMEPGLEASATFDPPNFTFSNGVVVAKVEVDLETGVITLLSLCLVHDCGTVIDAALVEGQIQGAIAQGVGEALLEELVYDGDGQPLSGTFTDYLLPCAQTIPELKISHMESPTPVNLLGAKGVGESGTIGTPVAIANAVEDALSSFDYNVTQLPVKAEQVLRAIRAKSLDLEK